MLFRCLLIPRRCLPCVRRCSTSCSWRELLIGQRALVSSSRDIFSNVALEDWLYSNQGEGDESHLLFFWRNEPSLLLGVNRNMEGKSVFHDDGNLNCTFFSRRSRYDRRDNLGLLCRAISSRWPGLRHIIFPRDEIQMGESFKISYMPSKLWHKNQFRILFKMDKQLLASVLKQRDTMDGLESVTKPEKTIEHLTVGFEDELIEAIGNEYNRQFRDDAVSPAIPVLDPDEKTFPGLSDIQNRSQTPNWIFGKHARFTLRKDYVLPPQLRHDSSASSVRLKLQVYSGVVEKLGFEPNDWMRDCSVAALVNLVRKKFLFGSPLVVDGSYWNDNDDYERVEKRFIQESVTKLTSA